MRTSMHNLAEEIELDDDTLEIENRCRNLLWTVSGDYTLDMKPDAALYRRSKEIALYDGMRQGAFAKFFDRRELSLYLVKKVYLQANEESLKTLAKLCVEEAVGDRLLAERPGVKKIRRKAFLDILEQEYEEMPSQENVVERLRMAFLNGKLDGANRDWDASLTRLLAMLEEAQEAEDTRDLIRIVDWLYNTAVDPTFERLHGGLDRVLSVTIQELTENRWEDFLTEEMYEAALESLLNQMGGQLMNLEKTEVTEEMEEERTSKRKIKLITQEQLDKAYTYVELNFGRSYLSEQEQRRLNSLICRDIHSDCSLYFTEGILKNPVRRNYQYEYARRLRNKNLHLYHDKHRIATRNIEDLTNLLRKALIQRSESQNVLSDRGVIVPSRMWRIGRSPDARVFEKEIRGDSTDFVVDVLMDASGSQMERQEEVALQAYMISEALSNAGICHRVMSYCTFWDYTILHRFREYEDPKSANENIFSYVTSSNNRDGLAIRAVSEGLLSRDEERKILIVLSDGRPYDVIVNRPNARNPKPYQGRYAIADTAAEVRRLRNAGVSVLGVFVGEENDLSAEKKIFGKDFAYIRSITGFSRIVGRYLTRLFESEE